MAHQLYSTLQRLGVLSMPDGIPRCQPHKRSWHSPPFRGREKDLFENDAPYESSGGAGFGLMPGIGRHRARFIWFAVVRPDHRIIGQLYGGAAACSMQVNNGSYDFYGRFDVSWGLGVSIPRPLWIWHTCVGRIPHWVQPRQRLHRPDGLQLQPKAINDDGSCGNDDCGVCGGDNSSCGGAQSTSLQLRRHRHRGQRRRVINGVNLTFTLLTDNYPGENT